ncbi:hypothetical protein SteCoe_35645 [Stentor coeruleus]|uniref:Uncharacterized protein n=1 Tax=Stentor coeruleus TaxID=5963 RepID=A0A1R2ARS2_9CILI|nr:hypothetical protein SteCoe_35645 [Stentor coeruleus]
MLKCSDCKTLALRQCNSCEGKLLCEKCSQDHIFYHEANNSYCIFGRIRVKLPKKKIQQLRESIQESINTIEKQKLDIMKEAEIIIKNITNIVTKSHDELDKIIDEYMKYAKISVFEAQDVIKVEDIINELLVFEYPDFSSGALTKNWKESKPYGFKISEEAIKSEYNLLVKGHTSRLNCVAITSDNRYLLTGSNDTTVRIWDIQERRQESILSGHTDNVVCIKISNNNQFALSGSFDEDIIKWNLIEKKKETIFIGHTERINSISISNDNSFFVSGSGDD